MCASPFSRASCMGIPPPEHPSPHLRQTFQPSLQTPLLTTLSLCSPIKAVPAVRSRRMHREGADKYKDYRKGNQ